MSNTYYSAFTVAKKLLNKDNKFIILDECWENLAYAIVRQAAEDYQELLKWKTEKISCKSKVYSRQEIEDFFNSEYFALLYPNITGREILAKIKRTA